MTPSPVEAQARRSPPCRMIPQSPSCPWIPELPSSLGSADGTCSQCPRDNTNRVSTSAATLSCYLEPTMGEGPGPELTTNSDHSWPLLSQVPWSSSEVSSTDLPLLSVFVRVETSKSNRGKLIWDFIHDSGLRGVDSLLRCKYIKSSFDTIGKSGVMNFTFTVEHAGTSRILTRRQSARASPRTSTPPIFPQRTDTLAISCWQIHCETNTRPSSCLRFIDATPGDSLRPRQSNLPKGHSILQTHKPCRCEHECRIPRPFSAEHFENIIDAARKRQGRG